MAKQIKVIKCPNCGSVQKTEIKLDHYRCDNCQTEYFLDNDDININVNHQSNSPKYALFTNSPALKLVCAAIITIIAGAVITALFKGMPTAPPSKTVVHQVQNNLPSNGTNTLPVKTAPGQKQYQVSYQYCSTVLAEDKAYILSLEDHSYTYSDHNFFFVIYDLMANKKIKEEPIDKLTTDRFGQGKWLYLDFSKDKTYFIANDNTVYLLDKVNYKFTNITQSLLSNHLEYQTGLASITISQTTSGKALHILTNDGKKIYYYPLLDEVYLDDYDFQMVKNRPKRPPNDTSEHIAYDFANRNGENNKLIQFSYISHDGKPHLSIYSSRAGDDKRTDFGKHTDDNTAYDILIDSAYSYNNSVTIVDHKNLTPGRLYFDPSVLYFDQDTLIIKTKVNAAPGSGYNYQQIDVQDGKVLWTLSDELISIKEIIPYGNSFIAKQDCNQYAIMSANGNIIKRITLNNKK